MAAKKDDEVPSELFKGVTFYIAGDIAEDVQDLLAKYGGKKDNYLSEMVSHVIADDVENSDYQEARELFELPCVMSEWVTLSVLCKKQLDKEVFAPEGRLFSGVIACPSKLDESDWLSLYGMIVYNGGRCQTNLSNKCTHLITSAMEGPKYETSMKHEKVNIVTPDWVNECITKGGKQDEALYHPRLVVYPKPPSPPKPETPPPPPPVPKEEAMETNVAPGSSLQVPMGNIERKSPSEMMYPGSRPGTPGSASTKEALAKVLSNRMQDMPYPRHSMPPHPSMMGQYPMQAGPPMGPMRPGMHPTRPPQPPHMYPPGSHAQAHDPQQPGGPGHRPPHMGPRGHLPGVMPPGGPPPHSMSEQQHQQLLQTHQQQLMQLNQQQQNQQKLKNITNNIDLHKQHQAQQQHLLQQQQAQAQHAQQQAQHQHQQQMKHQQQQAAAAQSHQNQLKQHQQQQAAAAQQSHQNQLKQQQKMGFPGPGPVGGPGGHLPRQPPPYFPQQNMPPFMPPGQQTPPWPQFTGHDPNDNIPADMCLLGCVFYISDYTKLLGQEQVAIWKKVIEQHGGQVDVSYSNRVTHVLCANQNNDVFHLALRDQRRIVTAFWLNDVLTKKKLLPPWQALHLPLLYSEDGHKPCSNQIMSITNFEGEERTRVKQMINALGAKYTGYMTRTNSVLICKSNDSVKYKKAKDWEIAVVNVRWLSDLILGYLQAVRTPIDSQYLQISKGDQFQMDMNKAQHLMVAWRTPLKITKDAMKKCKAAMKKAPGGQENMPSPAKKPKIEKDLGMADLSQPGPRVLFTGFPKAVTLHLQTMVLQLGGQTVDSPQYCTHMVARSFSRTMKFFIAINVCHHIVTSHWVENSYKHGSFLDENMFMLQDIDGEKELKCSLGQSLARAHTHKLFAGMTFYFTPSVQPPVCDLQKIVESAGGSVAKKRRLTAKTIETLLDDKGLPTYIVITCADDIHLCNDLLLKKIKVYTAEFILTGVMRQEKDFAHFQLEVER